MVALTDFVTKGITTVAPVVCRGHECDEMLRKFGIGHHVGVGVSQLLIELDHDLAPVDRIIVSAALIPNDLLFNGDSSECVGRLILVLES
jgi:hypothetical protein